MITRVEAYGYRCFPRLSVDFDRYHVLAGGNGAGKTTLLDIPVLLGDLLGQQRAADAFLRPQPARRVPRARTLTELLHQGHGESLTFSIEARLPADIENMMAGRSAPSLAEHTPTHLRYEVRLEVFNYELRVVEEYLFLFPETGPRPQPGVPLQGKSLTQKRTKNGQVIIRRPGAGEPTRFWVETTTRGPRIPDLKVPPGQLALGAVLADPELFPAALWLGQLLREGVVFYNPDWDSLREAAPPGDPVRLLPDGRNTPWLALHLQQSDPDRFRFWVDHVRTALPQVADITAIEREEDHYAYFAVNYAGGYRVTSSGLSEGTLRILALSLLPYLPTAAIPRLLATEEPENGIHPRAIETVVQSLSSIYNGQVLVSTQSPIVLANTELSDVLAARIGTDGAVTVIPGDEHPQLREWQGNIDIGTLFAAGVFS
ncbi:AAA family ATPase [Actinoplanes sp. NBC_00393]|uniref:methylation-associated defense system AAA family ATPase MAD3 n=1 Tax=Actinoplanes sp. NBC_00393 TaxID=2975953 RepID=UPI002E1A12A5